MSTIQRYNGMRINKCINITTQSQGRSRCRLSYALAILNRHAQFETTPYSAQQAWLIAAMHGDDTMSQTDYTMSQTHYIERTVYNLSDEVTSLMHRVGD
jgi:hypothetical protein